MKKISKSSCKLASHRLFKDKARNHVDDLQVMFLDLQFARKESRTIDAALLEEQVHQMLREWKAEIGFICFLVRAQLSRLRIFSGFTNETGKITR